MKYTHKYTQKKNMTPFIKLFWYKKWKPLQKDSGTIFLK